MRKCVILYLVIALLVSAIGVFLSTIFTSREPNEYQELQLEAGYRTKEAMEYLKGIIIDSGIEIEMEDLNQTGLLGPEFTELTSTPGNLGAKRTSLNPNFAALLIKWYMDIGLKPGDKIAIGTSGSFPGLVISTLVSAHVMGLDVEVIASLGASMHGATRVDFNIFDILHHLKEGGYADFDLLAVSPGGNNDNGGSTLEGVIFFGTKELALDLCNEVGVEVICYDDITKSIKRRLELYSDDIKLFINIGGASPNCGTSSYTLNFPSGLVLDPPRIPVTDNRGLNYEYAARGIPIINLLNVRGLCDEYGIAYDPVPMEDIGSSGVYSKTTMNRWIISICLVVSISLVIVAYLRGRRK